MNFGSEKPQGSHVCAINLVYELIVDREFGPVVSIFMSFLLLSEVAFKFMQNLESSKYA